MMNFSIFVINICIIVLSKYLFYKQGFVEGYNQRIKEIEEENDMRKRFEKYHNEKKMYCKYRNKDERN